MPSSPTRPPIVGVAIVLVAASLFGTLGPLARFTYEAGMTPLSLVAWRAAIGFLGATAFVAWRLQQRRSRLVDWRRLDRSARASLLVAAVSGFLLNQAMFSAFELITVALALLAFYTYPVMVAVANAALGREPMDRPRIVALALAVAGMVAVVASQFEPDGGIRFEVLGVGLALSAALSQAVFVLLSRSGYRAVPADQAMAAILSVTALLSAGLAVATGAAATLARPIEAPAVLPLLGFAGFFAAAIPSVLFLTGIRLVGGTTAGILMLFEPVVGVALAAVLLSEAVAPIQVVGGLAILVAAIILQRATPASGRAVAAPAVEAEPA